ncbi:methylamine utilization protein [Sphingomonas psychrotolerans]|uniref:Methylamine utilization protein n=1 Tax=Sphingomonas psychrotolerans TaxID=1327635 RepID=A0ABU3NAZ9_9SPHN|nr:methylamine utilization protein [Sphingomonas psychrotolerans]MDT8760580.1 methylamine utilization protein [Sphingomonas psychrotolerans]
MKPTISIALGGLFVAIPAQAGDVAVRVVDASGNPVKDAVVTIHPAAGVRGPIRFPWPTAMVQKNIAFNPGTLIVPVGATVAFPNEDKVRHHVYSFSKPARFELKLFGKDQTRSYTFRTAGAVALGCNIHDSMSGFIKVVDTPFANKTADDGATRLTGVTGGSAQITVWHPRMRGKDNEVSFAIEVPAQGNIARRIQIVMR